MMRGGMTAWLAALGLALGVAGCQTDGSPPLEPVGAAKVSQVRSACEADGGNFGAVGDSGLLACVKNTRDAGKFCRAASDCESACLARSQTCAPITPLFGCHEILNAGGVRLTQCVD